MRVIDFDASEYLDDDEVVAEVLTAALENPDPDVFLTVGNVAKARGMTSIAEDAGLGREPPRLCHTKGFQSLRLPP